MVLISLVTPGSSHWKEPDDCSAIRTARVCGVLEVFGLLFLMHGLQKLVGLFGGMPGMNGAASRSRASLASPD